MYDLEILVPVELNDENIARRFKDFRRYGFINTAGPSVKLYFAASHDNNPDSLKNLCEGWPDNFDVEYFITPYKHVSQRIMFYYTKVMQPDRARWYVRMDEDTRTDIAGLVKEIDKWFDHEKEHYVVSEVSKEVQDYEYRILKMMGYDWFDEIVGYDISSAPIHEIEISVTSNVAIKKILSSECCQNFLKAREAFAEGCGDHALAFAARMEKIYPISVPFMTRNPRAIEFSLYGGRYYHIHDISRDRHPEYVTWLDLTDGNTTPELTNTMLGKNYFFDCGGEKTWIGFEENGRIRKNAARCSPEWSHKTQPFGIWGFTKNGDLTIFITHDFFRNVPHKIFKKVGEEYYCRHDEKQFLTDAKTNDPKLEPAKKQIMI